jgi:hypothetical protein
VLRISPLRTKKTIQEYSEKLEENPAKIEETKFC